MIFKEWVSTDLIEELVLGMDDRSPIPHVNHLKPGGQLPHHTDRVPEISIYTSEPLVSENNIWGSAPISHWPEIWHLHIGTVSLREQWSTAAIGLHRLRPSLKNQTDA